MADLTRPTEKKITEKYMAIVKVMVAGKKYLAKDLDVTGSTLAAMAKRGLITVDKTVHPHTYQLNGIKQLLMSQEQIAALLNDRSEAQFKKIDAMVDYRVNYDIFVTLSNGDQLLVTPRRIAGKNCYATTMGKYIDPAEVVRAHIYSADKKMYVSYDIVDND